MQTLLMIHSIINLTFFLQVIRAMSTSFEIKSTAKVFDGSLIRFSHMSLETKTMMTCSVFLPHKVTDPHPHKCPALMYLSGLTCTDENVCQKSGIFKTLSELQVSDCKFSLYAPLRFHEHLSLHRESDGISGPRHITERCGHPGRKQFLGLRIGSRLLLGRNR